MSTNTKVTLVAIAIFAGIFGLVHGAGFANYLRSLFVERIAAPLFGFNIGIEAGQLLVLIAAFALFAVIDGALSTIARAQVTSSSSFPMRVRVAGVSLIVAIVAARWAVARYPW